MAEYSYEQYTVREKLVLELLEFARHQVKDMGAKASMYRVATHCVNRGGFRACSYHVNSQPTALKKFRHSIGVNIWQTSPIAFQTSSKVLAPAFLR